MSSDDTNTTLTPRKRRKRGEGAQRMLEKIARYTANVAPVVPRCVHEAKQKTYSCNKVTLEDAQNFYELFYKNPNKQVQDCMLLIYTSTDKPKRQRSVKGGPRKKVATKYFVLTESSGNVQVCQKAFTGILQISKDRIQRIVRRHLETGEAPKENRGGFRPKPKVEILIQGDEDIYSD